MENKKDIGKAFRDKLDRLDRAAPNSGWNAISGELQQMKLQRRFPWRRVFGLSILLLLVGLFASYPLWKNSMPRIYMEMPEEHESLVEGTLDTTVGTVNSNDQHEKEKEQEQNTAIEQAVEVEKTVSISIGNRHNRDDLPPNIIPPSAISKNEVPESNIVSTSRTVQEEFATVPKAEVPTTDEGEGKFKVLDLSGVTYGTDSLKAKKEKKLDTKRISDSLNKLYGRERPVRKNKKTE